MTAAAIIIAVVLIVVIVALVTRARGAAKQDHLREEAEQHRRLADVTETEAQRKLAEADERAARAKQEQLAAEQARLEASGQLTEADDLRNHAASVDPDTEDHPAEAHADRDGPPSDTA